jgi:lysophospholipase L1-like esterase
MNNRVVGKSVFGLLILFSLSNLSVEAQDPGRFRNEVRKLIAGDSSVQKKNLILFTGSSSVRLWKTLNADFPGYNILNRGFGGSTTTDLHHYIDTLITPYKPVKVFIYEGDNDIGEGKAPDDIIAATIKLVRSIKDKLPDTQILFISPKPSLARWHLKNQYELYNSKLKSWAATQKGVSFIDVWTPMLHANGLVRSDLFVADGLHMNEAGYEIWKQVIAPYLAK